MPEQPIRPLAIFSSLRVNEQPWISRLLRLAAVYHVLLGLELLIDPTALFVIAELPAPNYDWLVRGLGGYILMMAFGYAVASRDPYRYWVIGFIGLAVKLGITIGISVYIALGLLPVGALILVLINDVVWLLPLWRYQWRVYKQYEAEFFEVDHTQAELSEELLSEFVDQHHQSLIQLNQQSPHLLVFLRHFGCTFCRETLAQLAQQRETIEAQGVSIVLIHQSEPGSAESFFNRYGLGKVSRISDPDRKLYQAFELKRGEVWQVFGWKSWLRGFEAGVLKKHGIGLLEGDGYQMPGAFLINRNRIIKAYRHHSAADKVDYCELLPSRESDGK